MPLFGQSANEWPVHNTISSCRDQPVAGLEIILYVPGSLSPIISCLIVSTCLSGKRNVKLLLILIFSKGSHTAGMLNGEARPQRYGRLELREIENLSLMSL